MDENMIKQQAAKEIEIQGDLCPELFGRNQKLLPEVKETLTNIAEFSSEVIKNAFVGIELEDVLICGGCATYVYNEFSNIDLVLLWKINEELLSPEQLEQKLKMINSGFPNRGFVFNIFGRNVKYVNYATLPAGSGLYSVTKDKWLEFPERNHFVFSVNELYDRYMQIVWRVNNFMQNLPKDEKGFLSPADCKKAENLYNMLQREALEIERESKEKEYNLDYNAHRCFFNLGEAGKLKQYIKDSYNMYFQK